MSRSVSNTFFAASNAQTTDEVFVVLLTFSHPNLGEDIRISSDTTQTLPLAGVDGTISNGSEFLYAPFSVQLPDQTSEGISRASISVDNVDRTIVASLRTITSPINLDIDIVLASDPDTVEARVTSLELRNVTYDALTISGDLSKKYFDTVPCPGTRFTPSLFRGLF